MGTLVMRRLIMMMMMMVVVFTRRHLRIAQDDCETSIDRRQHEPSRNEGAQEQHSKDEQCCPSWIPAGLHPLVHTMHQSPTCLLNPAASGRPNRIIGVRQMQRRKSVRPERGIRPVRGRML
jgi:hypothetical protein